MKISKDIQWRREGRLFGDVELIGTLKISSMSVIKGEVAGDKDIEEHAKAQAIRTVHAMLYGDVQDKLAELERILMAVLPASVSSDGPLEKVRELQSMISEYR